MGPRGDGGGLASLSRFCWQAKALMILTMDVPEATSIAWLKSLPDKEGFLAYSMFMGAFDYDEVHGEGVHYINICVNNARTV